MSTQSTNNELKSAEDLFNLWCGNSYCEEALTDVERIRWQNLLKEFNVQLLNAYKAGMTEAAHNIVGKRAEDYDKEHGWTDSETGTREYPKHGEEYMIELDDIQQAIISVRDSKTL